MDCELSLTSQFVNLLTCPQRSIRSSIPVLNSGWRLSVRIHSLVLHASTHLLAFHNAADKALWRPNFHTALDTLCVCLVLLLLLVLALRLTSDASAKATYPKKTVLTVLFMASFINSHHTGGPSCRFRNQLFDKICQENICYRKPWTVVRSQSHPKDSSCTQVRCAIYAVTPSSIPIRCPKSMWSSIAPKWHRPPLKVVSQWCPWEES